MKRSSRPGLSFLAISCTFNLVRFIKASSAGGMPCTANQAGCDVVLRRAASSSILQIGYRINVPQEQEADVTSKLMLMTSSDFAKHLTQALQATGVSVSLNVTQFSTGPAGTATTRTTFTPTNAATTSSARTVTSPGGGGSLTTNATTTPRGIATTTTMATQTVTSTDGGGMTQTSMSAVTFAIAASDYSSADTSTTTIVTLTPARTATTTAVRLATSTDGGNIVQESMPEVTLAVAASDEDSGDTSSTWWVVVVVTVQIVVAVGVLVALNALRKRWQTRVRIVDKVDESSVVAQPWQRTIQIENEVKSSFEAATAKALEPIVDEECVSPRHGDVVLSTDFAVNTSPVSEFKPSCDGEQTNDQNMVPPVSGPDTPVGSPPRLSYPASPSMAQETDLSTPPWPTRLFPRTAWESADAEPAGFPHCPAPTAPAATDSATSLRLQDAAKGGGQPPCPPTGLGGHAAGFVLPSDKPGACVEEPPTIANDPENPSDGWFTGFDFT